MNAVSAQASPSPASRPTPPAGKAAAAPSARSIHQQRLAAKSNRRRELALWVPDHSTPFRLENLQLRSQPAQYVYHLGLVMAQRSLYFFYFTLPDNNDAVKAAETVVTSKIDQVDAAITAEIERLRAVATAITADDLNGYTKPFELEVAMYTPEAARIANIVRKFDGLVQLADALWFASHINRNERGNIIFKYRQAIIGLARQMYLLSRQAMNSVRRQQQQRELDRFQRDTRRAEAKAREGAPANASGREPHNDEAASEPADVPVVASEALEPVAKLPAKKKRAPKVTEDASEDKAGAAVA